MQRRSALEIQVYETSRAFPVATVTQHTRYQETPSREMSDNVTDKQYTRAKTKRKRPFCYPCNKQDTPQKTAGLTQTKNKPMDQAKDKPVTPATMKLSGC